MPVTSSATGSTVERAVDLSWDGLMNSSSEPTIKEVAERAGVALSSVSRVLNEHPDVSAQMRERVLRAVEETGYQPNLLASSLRRGSTRTIGFVVADIVNPLFASIFTAAEKVLRDRGYSLLLVHSEEDPERDVESIRLLRRRQMDGLIISLSDEHRAETITELERLDVPLVLLDRDVPTLTSASVVLADHRVGVRRATEHLLTLGHRRVGFITSSDRTRPARERMAGFREGYESRGVDVPEDLVLTGSFSRPFGERMTEQLLRSADPPTAIIAGGNLIFVGTIATLHRHRVGIGDDIALIACDDVPLAEYHSPPITVVRRSTEQMGVLAAELLLDRLTEDGDGPRIETISTELVVRESTYAI